MCLPSPAATILTNDEGFSILVSSELCVDTVFSTHCYQFIKKFFLVRTHVLGRQPKIHSSVCHWTKSLCNKSALIA